MKHQLKISYNHQETTFFIKNIFKNNLLEDYLEKINEI
jgi:hypothetical protein